MKRIASFGARTIMATIAVAVSLSIAAAESHSAEWLAGAASVVITPDDPVWMAGYSSRNQPSQGVSQNLYAKALIVQDEPGARFVMVTVDLVAITQPIRSEVERQISGRYGLEPSALLMNASHTHSAPEVRIHRMRIEERETAWIERADRYVQETSDSAANRETE